MPTAVEPVIVITVSQGFPDDKLDEILEFLDEGGLEAVAGPVPGRMGLSDELVSMIITAPLDVLATVLLTAAGHKLWAAITTGIRRRRTRASAPSDDEQVVLTVFDAQAQVRVDLTLDDLSDDRVVGELGMLRDLTGVVIQWDRPSGVWTVRPSTSHGETGK